MAGARDAPGGHGERRWFRAMQIIAEPEGTTHGPDAGCVGYFSFWWGERTREPARQ